MQNPLNRKAPRLRSSIPLMATIVCLAIVFIQLRPVSTTDIWTAVADIAWFQWGLAIIATGISFMAVGQYDVVWHRLRNTGLPARTARVSGMSAIALGQTIGLGVVTGTFVRWHMLHPLPFKSATAITLGVSASFLGCWAVLALPAALWIGVINPLITLGIIGIAICFAPWIKRRIPTFPHYSDALRLLKFGTIDLTCAGITLWVLIPDATLAILPTVVAAYILALGAGLLSNAPGGMGAFEMVLLFALGGVAEPSLIAGILGFRAIYYLGPALLAAGVMLYLHRFPLRSSDGITENPVSDLCHQGAKSGASGLVLRQHLFGSVALEPQHGDLGHRVKNSGFQAYYKCPPRVAVQARKTGWVVRHIADDAIIYPQSWSTAGPKRRQLRRKLSQANTANVVVTHDDGSLPVPEMTRIADSWAEQNGGELGYAMGRYDPSYVARQQVFLIWHNADLCGFISVQTRNQVWAIDLIRHLPQMPSGAMHAATCAVIEAATAAGVTRLHLGAVPNGPTDSGIQNRFAAHKAGLRQFKSSFAPYWAPRYHAAPSRVQWAVSMALIFLHIQRPIARVPYVARALRTKLINMSSIFHLKPSAAHVRDTEQVTAV